MARVVNLPQEDVVEIPTSEYEAIKAVSAAIAEQNALIVKAEEDTAKSLLILAEAIKQKREIVIPAPEVTVKAADVPPQQFPIIPTPQVTVQVPEEKQRKIVFKVIRDRNGVMTGLEGTVQ